MKTKTRVRSGALFTLGYEGRSPEAYLDALLEARVTLLCDVRRNPFSRKRGFSKNALARACEARGIRYEHLPELGIASADRKGLKTDEEYAALFRRYERSMLPRQGASIERISGWLREGERVALTCYEVDPNHCHRRYVALAVERACGLEADHL